MNLRAWVLTIGRLWGTCFRFWELQSLRPKIRGAPHTLALGSTFIPPRQSNRKRGNINRGANAHPAQENTTHTTTHGGARRANCTTLTDGAAHAHSHQHTCTRRTHTRAWHPPHTAHTHGPRAARSTHGNTHVHTWAQPYTHTAHLPPHGEHGALCVQWTPTHARRTRPLRSAPHHRVLRTVHCNAQH